MKRTDLINNLTKIIVEKPCPHPLRVAIDGVDAAGKTRLAEELTLALKTQPRQVIHSSVDGFHTPKVIRRRLGSLSPIGFYRDSYDYASLIENLLTPLGQNGSLRYRTAVFDIQTDQSLDLPFQTAQADAILLVDGIFLLRPCLFPYWDLTIFLQAEFAATVTRGIKRDSAVQHDPAELKRRYMERYVPGQQIYLREVRPFSKADIVIENTDLENPKFIKKIK